MANTSNNSNFSDTELDMARIYGVNSLEKDGLERNLEDLAGYNVNESEVNTQQGNNRTNVGNSTVEADRVTSNNSNTTQHEDLEARNSVTQQIEQRNDQMIPPPHRQDQTLPTVRPSQANENNNGLSNGFSTEDLHGVSEKNMDAFLRTQIGRNIRVQFLIGTDTLIEKSGVLLAVGNDFVVLREPESGEIVICDFDGAKFVNFEGTEAK